MSVKNEKVGRIEVDSFSFIWKIKDFEDRSENVGDCIGSPYFQIQQPVMLSSCHWYLTLYLFGCKNDYKNCLSLFLQNTLSRNDLLKIKIHFKISFLNHISNQEIDVVSGIHTYKSENNDNGCGRYNCMSREELFNNKDSLLMNNTLLIKCVIHLDPYSNEEFHSKNHFYRHFQNLYFNETFADITLQIGKRKIKAHKNILAARSPTFSYIIKKNQETSQDIIIEITDISYEVMNEVLSFIYCEKVNNIQQLAKPLLQAAYKCKLTSLKILCEKTLWKSLSVESAIEILKISDTCKCPELKSRAMEFVIENIKYIVQSNDFKLLRNDNPKLLEEILCAVAQQI